MIDEGCLPDVDSKCPSIALDPVTGEKNTKYIHPVVSRIDVDQNPLVEDIQPSQTSVQPIASQKNTTPESVEVKPLSSPNLQDQANPVFLPLVCENNIIRVNQKPYVKLSVIGKGGSCKVYRALSKDKAIVAIKKVNVKGMNTKAMDGYANEIALLRKLQGRPSIIQLYDSEVDVTRKAIYLVMELGEIDLNHVVRIIASNKTWMHSIFIRIPIFQCQPLFFSYSSNRFKWKNWMKLK